jgi:hypothetical protein
LLVVSVVLALVGALVTYAIAWLKRQKGVAGNAYALGVLDRIDDAARTAVAVTERELVDGLKKATDGGKRSLTFEEVKRVRDESIERARAYLTQNGVREAEKIMLPVELERLLRAKMEAAVLELRAAQ